MEVNKDEAIRCLAISQKHLEAGNFPSARKFCLKSIVLFETPEARKLLNRIDNLATSSSTRSRDDPAVSQTEEHPSAAGMKNRHAQPKTNGNGNGTAGGMGGDKREYTTEQEAVVKRVKSCKATAYYDVLLVKKDCDEAEIKKAYRKLALALHPDKNGAPGADEAFKLVSRAFQVLSDSQKRAVFDSGADPESRGSRSRGFASSPFANSAQFDGELSPEDLFNMFFGGASGASGFGPSVGGGPTVFTFGPGFRTAFTRGGGGTATNDSPRSLLVQLAPLLILFAFSILSNLPSLFSSPPVPDPRFSFSPTTKYHTEMESGHLGIHYYVNPSEFNNHPVIGAEMAKEGVKAGWVVDEPVVKEDGQTDKREPETRKVVRGKGKARGPALKGFEDTVERVYTNDLYSQCQRGIDKKQRAKDAELGIFGIGVDWDRVKEIEDQIVPSCKELERLGLFR